MHNARSRKAQESPAGSDNPTGLGERRDTPPVYRTDLDAYYLDEQDPDGFDFVANPHTE